MGIFGGSSGGLGFGATITLKDAFTATASKVNKAGTGLLRTLGKLGKVGNVSLGQLGGGMGGVVGKIGGAVAGMGAFYEGVYKPIQMAAQLEEQLFSLKAAFLSTGSTAAFASEQVDLIRPELLNIAKNFGADRAMVAEAMWQAISSGAPDAASAIAKVRDVAAGFTAFNMNMQDGIALSTDIMANYGDAAGTAADQIGKMVMAQGFGQLSAQELVVSMRQLLPVAKRAGFGWEETAAGLAGLTMGSGDAAQATTLLKNLLTQLGTIQGRGELAMRMRQIGLSIDETKMKSLGLMGTLKLIRERARERAFIRVGIDLPELKQSFKAAELQTDVGVATVALKMAKAMNEAIDKGNTAAVNVTLDRMGIVGMGADKFRALTYRDQAVALGNVLRQKERLVLVDAESAAAMNSLTDETGMQGKVAYQVMDAMGRSGNVLDEALAMKKNDPKKNFKQLREEFEQMQIDIGMQMMPMVMDIVKQLQKIDWVKVTAWINRTADDLKDIPKAAKLAVDDMMNSLDEQGREWQRNPWFWSNPINVGIQALGANLGFDYEAISMDMNKGAMKIIDRVVTNAQTLGAEWKKSLMTPFGPFEDMLGMLDDIERALNKNQSIWGKWRRESDSWTRGQRQDYLAFARIALTDYQTKFGKLDWHIRAFQDSWKLALEQVSTVPSLVADGWTDAFRQIKKAYDGWGNDTEAANKRALASTLDLQHKMRIAWGLEKGPSAPVPVGKAAFAPKPRLFDKPGSEGRDFEGMRLSQQEAPLYVDFVRRQRAAAAADAANKGSQGAGAPAAGQSPVIAALAAMTKAIEKLALRPVAVAIDGRQVATAVLKESDWMTSAE